MAVCTGTFRSLFLFDLAEEIALEEVRRILGAGPEAQGAGSKAATPGYVRFERPPVVERAGTIRIGESQPFEARLRYFDAGVVSVELEQRIDTDWDGLVQHTSRWTGSAELESHALALAKERVQRLSAAIREPYDEWIVEDYHILHLTDVAGSPPAERILAQHGEHVAQIIRGELFPLSEAETREVLSSRMSFYPSDLLVVGWMAALVYETPENVTPLLQLLEYANVQLVEYRRYDFLLGKVLAEAYDALGHPRNTPGWSWRMNREAEKLNALRLEVMDLTERTDNALKFVSDMFYARAFRMAATRVGVSDYRVIVEDKLKTAGELYEYMVSKYRDARMFVLEAMIVLILIIDLIFLFRGN